MKSYFARAISALLCLELILGSFAPSAQAAGGTGFSLGSELNTAGAGAEYVSGNYPGAILMPVNLWGSVSKPGIHHIPTQTDLLTLLSLAGGPLPDARMDTISIKRRTGKQEQIIEVDADDLLTRAGIPSPILEPNDIIVVPRDRPTISSNTVTTITFVGSVLGIILAGYALAK